MTETAPGTERGAYFWMDCLRFGAATAVVLEHARDLLFLTNAEAHTSAAAWKLFYFLTGFGHEAVMVFFVLSGFWISSAVDRRADRGDFWPQYMVDRMSRLMIVIVPALLLGGLLDLASLALHSPYALGQSGALTLQEDIRPDLGLAVLLGNALFLQTIAVHTFGSNGPLWSLANEFWYYLWFPALLLTVQRKRPSLALASFAVALIAPSFLEGFVVWLMGAGLYHLDKRQTEPAGMAGAARLLLPGTAAVLACALAVARLQHLGRASDLVVGGAFALFLWSLLRANPAPLRLARPVARFGAAASFSLYATHLPMLVLLATIVPPGGRSPPDLVRLAEFAATVLILLLFARGFAWATEGRTGLLRSALRRRLISTPAVHESTGG